MAINQQQAQEVTQAQSGGSWWVEEVSIGKGAITRVVQSPQAPQATGDILNVFGPYPTKADAEKASAHGTPTGKPSSSESGLVPVPSPIAGIAEVGAVLRAFFQQITRVEFWRSLGWIVLGVGFMGLGAYLWLHKEGLTPNAVPVPIPV